jgi:hypothetical protein
LLKERECNGVGAGSPWPMSTIGGAWGEKEKLHGWSYSKEIWSGKTKELLYRAVIFLGEFSHCDYTFFEEIGKFRFNGVNSR